MKDVGFEGHVQDNSQVFVDFDHQKTVILKDYMY